jgi:hypothetical protein
MHFLSYSKYRFNRLYSPTPPYQDSLAVRKMDLVQGRVQVRVPARAVEMIEAGLHYVDFSLHKCTPAHYQIFQRHNLYRVVFPL